MASIPILLNAYEGPPCVDRSSIPAEEMPSVLHAVKGPFKEGRFRSDDPNGVTWLGGNMNGYTYAVTYKGKTFSYDLNRDSVAKLRSIKSHIYTAFAGSVKLGLTMRRSRRCPSLVS